VVLNGADVTGRHLHRDGRLELTNLARENTLVVEAEFAYTETGTGLYRFGCVYSNANRGGAARIFCCFDQPDLRAPITLAVRAPTGWRWPITTKGCGGSCRHRLWRRISSPSAPAPSRWPFWAPSSTGSLR
jgi:aminopeptidase N